METVLIVEDDRVYARATTNWLVKNGINARYVLSVNNAKEFWTIMMWIWYCRTFVSTTAMHGTAGMDEYTWLSYSFPYHDRLRGHTRCSGSG